MPQTYFDHPLNKRYTWYSNDGRTKKVLDYMLTESFLQQFITNCVVNNDVDVETDHWLLSATLVMPETNKARRKPKNNYQKRKPDLKALNDKETRKNFTLAVREIPQTGVPETANEKSINLVNCLSTAAESTLSLGRKRHVT